MKVLAVCTKCGREFIGLPARLPAYDRYYQQGDTHGRHGECGGKIDLTDAGLQYLAEIEQHSVDSAYPTVTRDDLHNGLLEGYADTIADAYMITVESSGANGRKYIQNYYEADAAKIAAALRLAARQDGGEAVTDEQVERVARAMHGANAIAMRKFELWEDCNERAREHWKHLAKAGLLAQQMRRNEQ